MRIRRATWLATIVLLAALFATGANSAYAAQNCVSPNGAGGCFTSIQQAVDAAPNGATIIIKAGTYREQVTINGKDLTLAGQQGAVLQPSDNMQPNLLPDVSGFFDRSIIGVQNANVRVRALTIDGLNAGEATPGLAGISYINAGGEIRKNIVKNIGFGEPRFFRDITGDDEIDYEGFGIQVFNVGTTSRHITIAENSVTNYNANGITVSANDTSTASTPTVFDVDVIKNTVVGAGVNGMVDQYGIQFGAGVNNAVVTGTVKENKVSGNASTEDAPGPGYGVLVLATKDVAVDKNVLDNNQIGVGVYDSLNVDVVKNKITGPAPKAAGYTGVEVQSEDTQVHENTFTNLAVGIRVLPGSINTRIFKNTFKSVATEVDDQTAASMVSSAKISGTTPRRGKK